MISVILPVYNQAQYLPHAINSILNQTYKDFELVVINDGSKDKTQEIINLFTKKDSRLKPFINKRQLGVPRSLNRGINIAKGEYLARQDADDISVPYRLKTQVQYLQNNLKVGLVASQIKIINASGQTVKISNAPLGSNLIRRFLLFKNCLAHGSTMVRKTIIDKLGGYNPQEKAIEDYDLWTKVARNHQIVNLPLALYQHRRHKLAKSYRQSKDRIRSRKKISLREWHWLKNNRQFSQLKSSWLIDLGEMIKLLRAYMPPLYQASNLFLANLQHIYFINQQISRRFSKTNQ